MTGTTYIMGRESGKAALSCMPCTAAELADELAITRPWANQLIARLIQEGQAVQWGDKLTESGHIAPVYREKAKT